MAEREEKKSMTETKKLNIRKESIPRPWAELDEAQRKALCHLIKMLKEYSIRANEAPSAEEEALHRLYPGLRLNDDSNLLFLDGDRGTGKSTVLYSLLRASIENPDHFFKEANEEDSKEQKKEVESILKTFNRASLIWLDTLDLELLPNPANLFAALMVRIEEVFKREGLNKDDGLFPFESALFPSQSEHPWNTFSQLMRSVSIAWSSNIENRKGTDPDTYSEEVIKTERSRLKLKNFDKAIRGLVELLAKKCGGTKPLFILPVDDADLNPLRALDLFQLIRLINSPHIIFLIAGRYENLDKLFKLKYASDISQQLPASPRSPEHQNFILELSQNTAYAAIKKLLPGGDQYVKLTGLTTEEAMRYPDLNESSKKHKSLQEVLSSLPLQTKKLLPSTHLGDLFTLEKTIAISKSHQKGDRRYESQLNAIFQGPIRAIDAIWRELIQIEESKVNNLEELAKFSQRSFWGVLESEPALPAWVSKELKEYNQRTTLSQVFLEPEFHLPENEDAGLFTESNISFKRNHFRSYNLLIKNNKSQTFTLDSCRTGWALLHHDLNFSKNNDKFLNLNLNLTTKELMKSSVIENQSLLFSWPTFHWLTFHELESFSKYWQMFVEGALTSDAVESVQEKLDLCAYIWLRALTYMMLKKQIPSSITDRSPDKLKRWDTHVIKFFSQSTSKLFNLQSQYFIDLLKSFIIILSPERGISIDITKHVFLCIESMIKTLKSSKNNYKSPSINQIFNEVTDYRANDIIEYATSEIVYEKTIENIENILCAYVNINHLKTMFLSENKNYIMNFTKKLQAFIFAVLRTNPEVHQSDIKINPINSENISINKIQEYINKIIDFHEYLKNNKSQIETDFDIKKRISIKILSLLFIEGTNLINNIITIKTNFLSLLINKGSENESNKNKNDNIGAQMFAYEDLLNTIIQFRNDISLPVHYQFSEHPHEQYKSPQTFLFTDHPLALKHVLGKALSKIQPTLPAEYSQTFQRLSQIVQALPPTETLNSNDQPT